MPRIDQVQLRFWNILSIGLGSLNGEERVVLSPENQYSRLPVAEVLVPAVIERDIGLIVVKEIELNCSVPWTIEEVLVHRIRIRADSVKICNTVGVLKDGHFFRKEMAHRLLGVRIAIGPERLHRIECAADTFEVGIPILNDNALNRIGMFGSDPVPDWR